MTPNNFYKDGYDLTVENAQRLRGISVKAAETKDFGIACSLNILAAEESLKAFFLIIQHYHPNGRINNFEKIFHSHSVKHTELEQIVEFSDSVHNKHKDFLALVKQTLEIVNINDQDYKLRNKEMIESLQDDYEWFNKQAEKKLNFDEILPWLKDANAQKNRGLYVDKRKDSWLSPKDISEDKFNQEKKYTDAIFNYITGVEELFLREAKAKNFR